MYQLQYLAIILLFLEKCKKSLRRGSSYLATTTSTVRGTLSGLLALGLVGLVLETASNGVLRLKAVTPLASTHTLSLGSLVQTTRASAT